MSDNPALLDFLRHQLGEDEARAQRFKQAAFHVAYYDGAGLAYHQRFNADRMLRRVEADRRILDLHTSPHTVVDGFCVEEGGPCTHRGEIACTICGDDDGCPTVRLLALRYDDHPDYREEWRPA